MKVFANLALVLIIVNAVMIGYAYGKLYGNARTVNDATALEWVKGHDRGCDDINVSLNSNTGEMEGVCEVFLRQGVDYNNLKVYVIGEDAI